MKKAVCITFAIIQLVIVSLLLFAAGSTDYYIKRDQLFSNLVYAATGLVLTLIVVLVIYACRGRLRKILSGREKTIVIMILVLFLAAALFICINGFFYSDWDPLAILHAVHDLVTGHPEEVGTAYFSNHPNNLLLVWIYLAVMRLAGPSVSGSVLLLVGFQCILAAITGYILWKILRDIFVGDPLIPIAGVLLYGIWIMLSPWFIITYSDEAGLILPVVMLRLFQNITRGKIKAVTGWTILAAIAGIGYFIKPQIAIAFIAMMLLYIAGKGREDIKDLAVCLCRAIVAILASVILVRGVIIPSMSINLDDNKSFGMAHYFMMGLNDETDGVYSDEDTLYTDSFDTPKEKTEADLALAKDRIAAYGVKGLFSHSARKTMVNYGDGLFAWGIDGKFFAGRQSDSLGDVPQMSGTEPVWSFIMPEGEDHGKYSSFMQMVWVTVLIAALACAVLLLIPGEDSGSGFASVMRSRDEIYAVLLTLVGLFLFELLFEAKARYLFIYTPYFLIAALCGICMVTERAASGRKPDMKLTETESGH